jgi:hypothetical protein
MENNFVNNWGIIYPLLETLKKTNHKTRKK